MSFNHNLADFVEQNRASGSTTQIVFIAILTGGYVVVPTIEMKHYFLKKYRGLTEEQVVTFSQIRSQSYPHVKRPIFFDPSCASFFDPTFKDA
jgi:hypothetical protein